MRVRILVVRLGGNDDWIRRFYVGIASPCRNSVACVLVAAMVVVSCSSGDETRPTTVTSFHYVIEDRSIVEGEELRDREEGYYQAPDSLHIVSDRHTGILETILIGSRAWRRDATGWFEADSETVRVAKLAIVHSMLDLSGHEGFQEAGDGPYLFGEKTKRYRRVSDQFGKVVTAYEEQRATLSPECALPEYVRNQFRGAIETKDITVGEETGVIYSFVRSFDGPNISWRREMTVDEYNAPVTIEPPFDVLPTPETPPRPAQAQCPTS